LQRHSIFLVPGWDQGDSRKHPEHAQCEIQSCAKILVDIARRLCSGLAVAQPALSHQQNPHGLSRISRHLCYYS
jgi:hypothetical protein